MHAKVRALALKICYTVFMSYEGYFSGWFDGATEYTNPGRMGIGCVLKTESGQIVATDSIALGYGTSNIAEWRALLRLLELAIDLKVKKLVVYGDSQLVINQCTGKNKVKKEHLQSLKMIHDSLVENIERIIYVWIPRELNEEADELSTMCF